MTTAPAIECPKLRELSVETHYRDGRPYFQLSDPLRLSEHSLMAPQPWGAVLALLDGTTPIPEIANAFATRYGVPISVDDVQDLVDALDQIYLLDNDRSREARYFALEAYRSTPYRAFVHAPQGYPDTPTELYNYLEGFLAEAPATAPGPEWVVGVHCRRFGLLSPHIDFPRGGHVYAQVWQQAADAVRAADLVILLGTDHYGNDPFTLTRQHYATPYGVLPTALDIVDELADTIGAEAAYAGELRHRHEHSLELVSVWLHHMRRGEPVELVPMLVGSLHSYIMNGAMPNHDLLINRTLDTLRSATAGRRVAVIASGDMSHVGSAFGGNPLTPTLRANVRQDDDALIEQMKHASASGFFQQMQRLRDRNNVCGVSPIYLMLRLLDASRGELIGYDLCPADATDTSAVSICGMLFS